MRREGQSIAGHGYGYRKTRGIPNMTDGKNRRKLSIPMCQSSAVKPIALK